MVTRVVGRQDKCWDIMGYASFFCNVKNRRHIEDSLTQEGMLALGYIK